ncbi:MAG: hypothetical protein ICV54_01375 [Nostoc sp. C3-bin3]|nr:hypothetical protein [Nostoc sp. C3-bin3]
MGVLVTTQGVFRGSQTGNKKNSIEQWVSLSFCAIETYKGTLIPAEGQSKPNITIFPPDDFDFNSLQVGHVYTLQLEVGARASNGKAYPEWRFHKIAPK